MKRKKLFFAMLILTALLLSGCAMRTIEDMYALPRRSEEFSQFQTALDAAMENRIYAAPISGDNQQTVQTVDLDGDGRDEYLVFAMGDSNKPLQVLIFKEASDGTCTLSEVIESNGTSFEQVEYINFDERPGYELVIGRQVSDQVLRNVSVYSFAGGSAEQLFSIGYSRFITCDLDANGRSEVMVLRPGESETERGMAVLYSSQGGRLRRTVETELSQEPSRIRRIVSGKLYGGKPAVFVASGIDENAVVTDIFAMKNGSFQNVSFHSELNISVQTLLNFYVFAEDIDNDGITELPQMLPMVTPLPVHEEGQDGLLRWFTMDTEGREVDKLYTYHDLLGGWYVVIDQDWANLVTVDQTDDIFTFYAWNETYEWITPVFSIYLFTGASRDVDAQSEGRFPLHRFEGVAYAGKLEEGAPQYGVTKEKITESFRLIRQDWRLGES